MKKNSMHNWKLREKNCVLILFIRSCVWEWMDMDSAALPFDTNTRIWTGNNDLCAVHIYSATVFGFSTTFKMPFVFFLLWFNILAVELSIVPQPQPNGWFRCRTSFYVFFHPPSEHSFIGRFFFVLLIIGFALYWPMVTWPQNMLTKNRQSSDSSKHWQLVMDIIYINKMFVCVAASGILCCFNGFAASIYEGLCIFHHFIGSDCRSERFTLHILCNASEFGATEKKNPIPTSIVRQDEKMILLLRYAEWCGSGGDTRVFSSRIYTILLLLIWGPRKRVLLSNG